LNEPKPLPDEPNEPVWKSLNGWNEGPDGPADPNDGPADPNDGKDEKFGN
jgi:hypothetical protein